MKIAFSAKHKKIFQQMGIQTIYLFGSQANNTAHSLSDVDLGIVLQEPEKHRASTMDIYLKLYDIFTDVLPKDYLKRRFQLRAHEFDIVFLQFTPIKLQFEAIKNKKVLYETDKIKRLDYEEYVIKRYCDLQFIFQLDEQAILARI
ncbi:hypothetical protein COU03_00085 [bacterium (Candidatus Gribaldobacteria) CG10_big_fil_rev_8_21_14_0_10_41_12]|uniref:Polymerase beta nucleotidyltransferase domain-containing protein n=1 Tax=bacterium (Candidatus Gribaldobacteria) CG10_big_fil_rev_8_21_14_0_10_41_12 TaxID=2014277 RepID=A0A2H0UYE8_9BACT|nr:MAG: hypothetical protein COU03_00085 [bacterium (Candidatus Gribaldobacteria) CG10_big_fil_rev_8_21_14_0_10_41_12]